jgi:hypothetical protein
MFTLPHFHVHLVYGTPWMYWLGWGEALVTRPIHSQNVTALRQCKGKVHPITDHQGSRGGVEVIALLILDLSARRGWVVSTTPRPLYPRERPRYPLCRRLGGPQGRSGLVRKISPLPGIFLNVHNIQYFIPQDSITYSATSRQTHKTSLVWTRHL